jgi:hypothetical protein
MATIFGFGDVLISQKGLDSMTASDISDLTERAGDDDSFAALAPGSTPFSPIGLGKPISIEIAYVDTGGLAAPGFFGGRPGLLLTSAVKRLPIFESAPRAVNLIQDEVERGFQFSDLPATRPGTPLIYYSPALTDRGTAVTIELVFDKFPEDAIKQIGSLMGSAAGVPLFAPASLYLMAGGMLVKLFAQFAEKLADGKQSFSETLSIDIDRPGMPNTQPGFAILTNSSELERLVDERKLKFTAKDGLTNTADGKRYEGPAAYVVLKLDGTDRPDYTAFAPTMASAAILDRFLHTGSERPAGTDLILQSMKAFNDLHFRGKAEGIKRKLAQVGADSEEGRKLKVLFGAYVKNISDTDLQPAL